MTSPNNHISIFQMHFYMCYNFYIFTSIHLTTLNLNCVWIILDFLYLQPCHLQANSFVYFQSLYGLFYFPFLVYPWVSPVQNWKKNKSDANGHPCLSQPQGKTINIWQLNIMLAVAVFFSFFLQISFIKLNSFSLFLLCRVFNVTK